MLIGSISLAVTKLWYIYQNPLGLLLKMEDF